mgnify:FL=1
MSEYTNSGVYTRGNEEIAFNYNTTLTAEQKIAFVGKVVGLVVDDNYYDFLTDMLFDYEVVDQFTDVDVEFLKFNSIEKFLAETNIVEIVTENVASELIQSLRISVANGIEYKTGIHKNYLSEALAGVVDTLDKKIGEIDINGMMDMVKMINDVPGEFTADKLLDAYSKSDMYKKNQKKANASRKKRNAMIDELKVVDGNNNVNIKGNGNVVKSTTAVTTPVLSPTFEV